MVLLDVAVGVPLRRPEVVDKLIPVGRVPDTKLYVYVLSGLLVAVSV